MKLLALAPLSFIFGILKFFLNQLITTKFLERTQITTKFLERTQITAKFFWSIK